MVPVIQALYNFFSKLQFLQCRSISSSDQITLRLGINSEIAIIRMYLKTIAVPSYNHYQIHVPIVQIEVHLDVHYDFTSNWDIYYQLVGHAVSTYRN